MGKTHTSALWLQDDWHITPDLEATIGARLESWQARDGYNYALTSAGKGFPVNQPTVKKSGISPKATLAWTANDLWQIKGSIGKALRFPTVGELYQNVQTGTTFTQPNPYLKPENVLSEELAFERKTDTGSARIAIFEEHVWDALIGQTSYISGYATPVSFTQNVDETRQRGIELNVQHDDVLLKGLELAADVTYVNAKIIRNSGYVATVKDATSEGKHTPYVPDWRATATVTYHLNPQWSFSMAGRYSGKQFATVDNTDTNPATYMGFQSFVVADGRVNFDFDKHWKIAFGVDNINNRKYYLYHPFPQRTAFGELKYTY